MRRKFTLILISLLAIFNYSFAQVPNCITSTSPLNGLTAITTSGAVLRWSASSGGGTVAGYKFYFGTDASATNIYNGVSLGNVLTTTLGSLLCNQTYYWQVVPFNATGSATGCSIYSFSTSLSTSTVSTFASYTLNGNASDVSGNGKNGTLINSPTSVQDRNGNANSAYYFNGFNQEIQPGYSRVTPPTSFSISLWFNTTATVGGRLVGFGSLSSGINVTTDRILSINNSGVVSIYVYNGSNQIISSSANYNDGKWHNVVATLGTISGLSLYIDGNLVARNSGVVSAYNSYPNTNTGFWRIANDANFGFSSTYYNGILDDISISNREYSYNEAISNQGAFYNAQGCTGGNLILTASSLIGASYAWSGPNGFSSSLRVATVSGGVSPTSIGLYTVTVNQGSCSYPFNTTVISNPIISNNSITGSSTRCSLLPTTLIGTVPLGGDGSLYTYLWQSSTISSTAGFVGASGSGMGQNYTTSSFTSSTWFRRIAYSGGCSDISQPVLVSPSIANNTITTSSVSVCTNELPSVLSGLTPTRGGGGYVYQWLLSTASSSTGFNAIASTLTQNYTPVSPLSVTSWFRRVVTSAGFCIDTSAAVQVTVISSSAIPGNTATYGTNGWNVYGYNVQNNGNYPNDNSTYTGYTGFYTTTTTSNFDTRPLWGNYTIPIPMSSVPTYQGCLMPLSNMSFAAKGTGLVTASGLYRIDLPYYDDNVTLRINGNLYFQDPTWYQNVPKTGVYIGPLDNNDLVDLTINQGGGGVGLAVTITALTSTPGPLVAGSITGSDIICPGNTPTVLTNLATATGGCTPVYTWQISTDSTTWVNLSNSNSASYTPTQSVFQKTWYRRSATDLCGQGPVYTLPVVINMLTPPGNQTVYGVNMWKAYAFSDNVWGTYSGQWTEPGLNFNSSTTYGNNNPPSDPSNSTYQGCNIFNNYYSDVYKRQGFPSGNYVINLTSDDYIDLRVNGTMVYQNTGCLCGTTVAAWTGPLGPTDYIDIYHYNNAGPGYARFNFVPVTITSSLSGGIIGYDRINCSGNVPVPLANVTASWSNMTLLANATATWSPRDPLTNSCYVNPNTGYQWKISNDLITWSNISGANSLTYSPTLSLTTTTYFVRVATDVCGNTATSNFVTMSVGGAQVPTPTPTVGGTYGYGDGYWNVYGYGVQGLNPSGYIAFRNSNPVSLSNYAGFYQDSTLYRFDTRNQWGVNSGPSYAVSYPANYNGCVINTQLWAVWAKRTNIPTGTYQIDLGVDDDADLFIDNLRIFNSGCCGATAAVWVGTISGSTLVDVRGSNGNGPGYLTISLSTIVSPSYTLSGGTISGNQSICTGTTATGFTSVTTASGSCTINYKWQSSTNNSTWTDVTTLTSAWFATASNGLGYTYTTPLTTTTYFRRFVSDACGKTAVSNTITVTVYPTITPSVASSNSSLICSNSAFQLNLSTASGGNGSYTYQWQSSTVSSTNGFSNYTTGGCSGPFGAFLDLCNNGVSITTPTYFRAIISSGSCSTVATNAFLLSISSAPSIITQPANISACVGSVAYLTSSITGINPTYTWQRCLSPCTTPSYTNISANATFSGINAAQLTISGINTTSGSSTYRVLFGSACAGATLTSNSVNISLNSPPTINTNPSPTTICGSGIASFAVGASGTSLIYQWQGSTAVGGVYTNVANGTPSGVSYSGTTSSVLTVTATGATNYFYRALINSASCSGVSTTSGVSFVVHPVIAGNTFTSVSNFICNNTTTTLLGSVPSGGSGIYSYQWQTSPDNSTWSNASGGTSPTTQNYSPTAALTSNTYFQRIVTSGVCTSTTASNLISINSAPVYTLQPTSITTCTGNTVVFNVNATSSGVVQYFWQMQPSTGGGFSNLSVSSIFPTVTGSSLSVVSFPASILGSQFRARAYNGCTTVSSNTANINSFTNPSFDVQPSSLATCANGDFTMPYTITGYQTSVQWQMNNGSGWNDIANYGTYGFSGTFLTAANRTLNAQAFGGTTPQIAINGAQFRAIATGLCTSTISNTATLTVYPAIANNSISVTQNICSGFPAGTLAGSNVTGGDGNYTYQWFNSLDNVTFTSIPGATFINYYPGTMTNSTYYRRQVSSFNCNVSNSQTPTLLITVSPATQFVIEPTDAFVCNGTNALFTSSAVGLSVTYKWQYRTSSVTSFVDLPSSGTIPGYVGFGIFNTSNRNITLTAPPLSMNGFQYRCIGQGNCVPPFDTSQVVTLYMNPVPGIVSQPVSSIACANSTAQFAVVATAPGTINYVWQVNTGSGWNYTTTVNPYFNATTSTLGVLASLGISGSQYRSILSLGNCSATTSGATLTVNSLVGITLQPSPVTVCGGNNAFFTLQATGSGLNYQWLTSADNGSTWNSLSNSSPYSGVTSNTLSITSATSSLNGNLYAVIVRGSCNPSVTSTGVSLGVYSSPAIVSNPIDRLVCSGGNTFFNVSATGIGISYQWQLSTNSGVSWSNLSNSAPYSFVTTNTLSITGATVSMLGYQYRALLTATCFPTVTSSSATLTAAFASTWIGGVSSNWFDVSNWCSAIPTSSSDVLIQSSAPFMPTITGSGAICRDLVINSGASLTINSSNSLSVVGSWTNNGTFNPNSSTVIFAGTSLQSVSGVTQSAFTNITVNNSVSGVSLFSVQSITGTMTMGNNSLFNSNGQSLVFISSASNTARLAAVPASASFLGKITMQRYVPAKPTLRLMSSAVSGATIADWKASIPVSGIGGTSNGFDASVANINTVWYYDETINAPTTYEYVGAPNISMPLNVGQGYRVYVRGDRNLINLFGTISPSPVVMSVTNVPNIGTKSLPVTYSDYGAQYRDGTNLVGNPYPSEINWDAPGWTKVNMDNSFYMWDPNLGTNGQYFSYAAGVGVPARTNPSIIASSQAFFVKASAPGTVPSLIVTESVKTVAGHTANFRSSSSDLPNLVRVKLLDNASSFDETAVRFNDAGTVGFDKEFDAYKMFNSTLNISSYPSKGLDLSINTLPLSTEPVQIPLSVSSNKKGIHFIQINGLDSFDDSVSFYLKDYYLNVLNPVNEGDTYSFQITSDSKTQGSERFELVSYRKQVVTSNGLSSGNGTPVLKAYPNPSLGNAISLDIYNMDEKSISLSVTDVTGNLVYSNTYVIDTPTFSTDLKIFEKLSSGSYLIKVVSEKYNLTQKVIVIK